jgi:FkbM family methyltransferase
MGIVVTKYGRMHVIESDAVVSKSLKLYGEWADDELSLLRALIVPGMSVLDVGAFIGTHTLAFASFCGSQGAVTSFEPRREIFNVLAANVALNGYGNVTVHNLGLAEKAFDLTLEALDLDDGSNFGGLALEGAGMTPSAASYRTGVVTLDSLAPERVDLIKLDVEGMEARVLAGAAATIARCRPIVFCECNDVEGGAELLAFCRANGYEMHGYLAPAFNPANFNGQAENVWGDGKELALLLLPSESAQQSLDKLREHPIFAVARVDDLALAMLFKPQYVPEILQQTSVAALMGTRFPSPLASELQAELGGAGRLLARGHDEFTALEDLVRQSGLELKTLREASLYDEAVHEDMMRQREAELKTLREVSVYDDAVHEDMMRQREAELHALREAGARADSLHKEVLRQRDVELKCLREVIAQQEFVHQAMLRATVRFDAENTRLKAQVAQQSDRIEQASMQLAQLGARLAEVQVHRVDCEARAQAHIADLEARLRAVYASRSWRLTRPLRGLAQSVRGAQFDDAAAIPSFAFPTMPTAAAPGPEADGDATTAMAPVPSAGRLYACLADGSLRHPAIIFDHNGGGGSNSYSREIIRSMVAQGEMVLRVYCYEAQWFIQWVDGETTSLFVAASLEQVMDLIQAARTRSIVVNSVYGYMDVAAACSAIANLARGTGASLDFKVHDFLALCPSPHLSDFEQKYCGVPADPDVCRSCLKVNNAWYHSWFPIENRPSEIKAWRKPFADLFDAATTITFFDASSIPILRKDFSFDDSKVRVVPHSSAYFTAARPVSIKGPLHIGILGTLSHLKGGNAVVALQQYIEEQQLPVPLTVVGQSYTPLSDKVTVIGSYATDDLPDIVERSGINVIFMATIVPETFSYTISEAMEMGLPIVAFDIGAQGNRLKDYVLGKVIPLGASPQTMFAAMESCLKAAQEMKK